MMTSATLSRALSQLQRAIGRQSARTEFRWMQHTLDNPPPAIPPSANTLEEMVNRRLSGEPLQYILGSQPFGPLNLAVRPPVLIPRPETEDWTIRLASLLTPSPARPLKVLDLCTGSGCIPLLLCHLWPPGSAHATGVDVSPAAVRLATDNAALCGIPPPSLGPDAARGPPPAPALPQKNTFTALLADLTRPTFAHDPRLAPPYDLLTANPPYIPRAQYERLPASVRDFEDVRALLGETPECADGSTGLGFYYRIAELVGAHGLLRRGGGTLALEVGDGQAGDVVRIVEGRARVSEIDVWRDPWGKARVVFARA
ncbi:S-adenosyl-L-methionine-dependent methyltransferase [Dichomitus squalens]|nr:S-adenosyl-L-methionine-dependent methyltransferase [Dichomitus squalens]